jgi:hypothetical protein
MALVRIWSHSENRGNAEMFYAMPNYVHSDILIRIDQIAALGSDQ